MSLIVSIGLSSSLAATVANAAVGEVALALALVVAIARGLLAVASGLLCASVLRGSRVCSWRCCSLADSGASVFHDCCRVVHSVRLECIGVEWIRSMLLSQASLSQEFPSSPVEPRAFTCIALVTIQLRSTYAGRRLIPSRRSSPSRPQSALVSWASLLLAGSLPLASRFLSLVSPAALHCVCPHVAAAPNTHTAICRSLVYYRATTPILSYSLLAHPAPAAHLSHFCRHLRALTHISLHTTN